MSVKAPYVIRLADLAMQCVSREKGRALATEILRIAGDNDILLDLSDVEILTTSFIDELVLRISEAGKLEHTTFRYTSEVAQERLERVTRFRPGIVLRLLGPDGERLVGSPTTHS